MVNAASYQGSKVATDSIAAIFGAKLATSDRSVGRDPLPQNLAGTTVVVRDSQGTSRNAGLFFVSPEQINIQIPPLTALGGAIATITNSVGEVSLASFEVGLIAPGIFTASADGKGIAAGYVLRLKEDGSRTGKRSAVSTPRLDGGCLFQSISDLRQMCSFWCLGHGHTQCPGTLRLYDRDRDAAVSIAVCRFIARLRRSRSDQSGAFAKHSRASVRLMQS